ncbi:MAG: antitoxin [Gammaproteobacteria bacterium]
MKSSPHREAMMRTTLDIDDDILRVAREIARKERKSAGAVLSEMVRRSLTQHLPKPADGPTTPDAFYGFQPLPARECVVTNTMIDQLRQHERI